MSTPAARPLKRKSGQFDTWAKFFAEKKDADTVTPADVNEAKRIAWHAKNHGFTAFYRTTDDGKLVVYLHKNPAKVEAKPEEKPAPKVEPALQPARPAVPVELPLGISLAPRNGLWDKITEHAKSAYTVFWKDNPDHVDYEPWDVIMTHDGFVSTRMRWLAVGAYIASVGGAK